MVNFTTTVIMPAKAPVLSDKWQLPFNCIFKAGLLFWTVISAEELHMQMYKYAIIRILVENITQQSVTLTQLLTVMLFFSFLPFLVKKSLEYLPDIMSLRGTLPSSSMISAIWSTRQTVPRGENRQDTHQIHQTVSQSQAHSGCVGGGQREREVGLRSHTHKPHCWQRTGRTDQKLESYKTVIRFYYPELFVFLYWSLSDAEWGTKQVPWQIHHRTDYYQRLKMSEKGH